MIGYPFNVQKRRFYLIINKMKFVDPHAFTTHNIKRRDTRANMTQLS